MSPLKFLLHMDELPPFVLCALVKTVNGKPVSLRHMQKLTGWSRCTVIRCCRSTSWGEWTMADIIHFHSALNLTPMRVAMIRSECMSGKINLKHIARHRTRKHITARLASLFTKMLKEKNEPRN